MVNALGLADFQGNGKGKGKGKSSDGADGGKGKGKGKGKGPGSGKGSSKGTDAECWSCDDPDCVTFCGGTPHLNWPGRKVCHCCTRPRGAAQSLPSPTNDLAALRSKVAGKAPPVDAAANAGSPAPASPGTTLSSLSRTQSRNQRAKLAKAKAAQTGDTDPATGAPAGGNAAVTPTQEVAMVFVGTTTSNTSRWKRALCRRWRSCQRKRQRLLHH
jgi:hypothetical protein